jgi:hypothetical protein
MNFDFNSLNQNQKFQLYAAAALLVSLFLPWWSSSFSANISAMGQSYGSSGSSSLSGFQLTGGIIPLLVGVAAAFFIFNNNKYVIWCGAAGLLFVANTYFGIVPMGNNDASFSLGSMGGVSSKSGFQFGLYIYAVAAAALTFFAYRENNLQSEAEIENTEQPEPSAPEQSQE